MKVPMFKFFRQHDRYAKRYLCAYCGINAAEIGEYEFMLKPDLWRQCGGRRRPVNRDDYKNLDCGMLCIGCIELRLGRFLCRSDFYGCPLTANVDGSGKQSERLLARLSDDALPFLPLW